MADPEQGVTERVFVYGTLRRGGSNTWRMAAGRCLGVALVPGRLYQVSWYPALVLDAGAGMVTGEIWEMPAAAMPDLDRFEGISAEGERGEYRRVKATVADALGVASEAWVWEWVAPTDGLRPLPGGDWLAVGC